MSGKPVQCPTADDALCQAMAAAVETVRDGYLEDADFGWFADRATGWYWKLKTVRTLTSAHPHLQDAEDTVTRRVRIILDSWRRRVAYYEQDFSEKEEGQ